MATEGFEMIGTALLVLAAQAGPPNVVADVCVPFVNREISTEAAQRVIERDFAGTDAPDEANRDGLVGVDIRYFRLARAGNRPTVVGLNPETRTCTVESPTYETAYQTIARLEDPKADWTLLPPNALLGTLSPSFIHIAYQRDDGRTTIILQLRPDMSAYIVTALQEPAASRTPDSVDNPNP